MSATVCLPEVSLQKPETLEEYFEMNNLKPLAPGEIDEHKAAAEGDLYQSLSRFQKCLWPLRPIVLGFESLDKKFQITSLFTDLGGLLLGIGVVTGWLLLLLKFMPKFGYEFSLGWQWITYSIIACTVGVLLTSLTGISVDFRQTPVFDRWEFTKLEPEMLSDLPKSVQPFASALMQIPGVSLDIESLGPDPGLWAWRDGEDFCVAWWTPGGKVQIGSRL